MSPIVLKPVSLERTLKFIFIGACVVFFGSYAFFQARNLIHGPSITLSTEPPVVHTDRAVALEGSARNVVVLRLNGREIHTNEQGKFEESLVLENGYTIMLLEAEDRYGRSTTLTRTYIYKPQT